MRSTAILALMLCLCLSAATVSATTVTFQPLPRDLYDLPHSRYVFWGIDWNPGEEVVTAATLRIEALYNWRHETNHLYIHLLDDAAPGVRLGHDNQGGGDYFANAYPGQQTHLTTFVDPHGGWNHRRDFVYNFDADEIAALNDYLANDNFGLGFDPDCHYYNCGVTLELTAEPGGGGGPPVPEPLTMLGVLAGVSSLGGYLSRRFQAG